MDDYPSNSQQPKTVDAAVPETPAVEAKIVEQVVTGTVVARKKPLGQKFKETFLGGDAKSVSRFVLAEVILPGFKEMLVKAVSDGVDRMVYGEGNLRNRISGTRPGGANGYVSYNRPTNAGSPPWRVDPREQPTRMSSQARANHDFQGLTFEKRVDADQALERLYDLISQYGQATVSDLYSLVGMTETPIDLRWGWTDLEGSRIGRERNGYFLSLPPTKKLD